jgi:hypothetical protein
MARDFSRPFAAASAELLYPGALAQGSKGPGVQRVQEWLTLAGFPCAVDSSYGPGTAKALAAFCTARALPEAGALDVPTWDALTAPLRRVLAPMPAEGRGFQAMTALFAARILTELPTEVGPRQNDGPWVRAFMLGYDGDIWEWCAGFVCFVLAQAAHACNVRLLDILTPSFGAPELARDGKRRGRFISGAIAEAGRVQAGDVFVVPTAKGGWSHTGIVLAVDGARFTSVEGNTSTALSPAGYAVFSHTRPLRRVDFVRTGPL